MKSTYQYSKEEERIIKYFEDLGVPTSTIQYLIKVSRIMDNDRQIFQIDTGNFFKKEDRMEIESFYIYDTIRYPPSVRNPHHTINQ